MDLELTKVPKLQSPPQKIKKHKNTIQKSKAKNEVHSFVDSPAVLSSHVGAHGKETMRSSIKGPCNRLNVCRRDVFSRVAQMVTVRDVDGGIRGCG